MPIWYEQKVLKIETAAPNVRWFFIERPEGFEFRAGQFVTFDLPIGEKRLQRWRSYSIANAPGGDSPLELCIVRSENGFATKFLFDEISEGSTLKFKGPDGTFCLPEKIEKDLVLICTGTGIAPFRSMVLDLKNTGKAHRKIHLIFGTRLESGVLYRRELEELQSQLPDFQFDVALSREAVPGFSKGYVHEIYLRDYAEKRSDVDFYICGWSSMIDDAVANLLVKIGFDRAQIHYELYG